jgi:aquaporin Z
MNKYITEFIGTFFLLLTIGCCVIIGGAGVIAPLAIGSILTVMVYAGGHISGGHYNPAITLGVWIRGRCAARDVIPYWIAQLAGATLAAVVLLYLRGGHQPTPMVLQSGPALLAEFLFTFALVYVVLNTATVKTTEGNSFFGLAIGFTVMAGAFSVGSISSAAFNPAVAMGLSIMGLSAWSNLWIYVVANLVGGAVAGVTFMFLHAGENIIRPAAWDERAKAA